jgi:hypothetical protein
VPGLSPETVLFVPDPVIAPGSIVQVPLAGRPDNTTLPVGRAQVGWVLAPTVGAAGAAGTAFIITLFDEVEVHPALFVTV